MQRLRKLWQDTAVWTQRPGNRTLEYILIGVYSSVAMLAVMAGLTARAGGLMDGTAEHTRYAARPEFRLVLKQLLVASADFAAGASVLVLAGLILYWGRRSKRAQQDVLDPPLPSGPPFLL